MNRKFIIPVVVIILLAIVIAIVLYLQSRSPEETPQTNVNTNSVVTNQATNTANVNLTPTKVLTEEEQQRQEVIRVASIFAERWGTYNGAFSTANLDNTRELMTSAFIASTESSIQNKSQENVTSSIETTLISSEIASFTLGKQATVVVKTLRSQTIEDGTENIVTQDLTLRLDFQDNEWKAASAQWGVASQIGS